MPRHSILFHFLVNFLLFYVIFATKNGTYNGKTIPTPIFYSLLRNSFKNDVVTLEKACDDSECYVIYDVHVYRDYLPQIIRIFGILGQESIGHSLSVLDLPSKLTLEALNTANWKVKSNFVGHCFYQIAIVEAPFWSGAISRTSNEPKNLLMIGLGGGNFNNYLAAKYNFLTITVVEISQLVADLGRRWFPSETYNRQRIIVQDGIKFMKKSAEAGHKYDIILLDATYSDVQHEFTSPVREFRSGPVIKNMAQLLGSKGLLVINVALGNLAEDRLVSIQKLISTYQFQFSHVLAVHPTEYNWVFLCRQRPISMEGYKDLPKPETYYFF